MSQPCLALALPARSRSRRNKQQLLKRFQTTMGATSSSSKSSSSDTTTTTSNNICSSNNNNAQRAENHLKSIFFFHCLTHIGPLRRLSLRPKLLLGSIIDCATAIWQRVVNLPAASNTRSHPKWTSPSPLLLAVDFYVEPLGLAYLARIDDAVDATIIANTADVAADAAAAAAGRETPLPFNASAPRRLAKGSLQVMSESQSRWPRRFCQF